MLVEAYEKSGLWYIKTDDGAEWSIPFGGGLKPKEEINPIENFKIVKKLKKEGFQIDEIIELFKEGVL